MYATDRAKAMRTMRCGHHITQRRRIVKVGLKRGWVVSVRHASCMCACVVSYVCLREAKSSTRLHTQRERERERMNNAGKGNSKSDICLVCVWCRLVQHTGFEEVFYCAHRVCGRPQTQRTS